MIACQDEEPDLMETIDHLDSDGSTVRLTARDGRPAVIWTEDVDGIDEFLEGE